ncbi:MAG: hypothetical protein LBQ60_04885 [Bacteroidales bacterium]|nr:hypothetical protein [Bacteroidales bacterium]
MLATNGLLAQPADSSDYSHQLIRSAGVGLPRLNYPFLSPLVYSGVSLGVHTNRFRERTHALTQFHTQFEIGILYNKATDAYITSLTFRGQNSWHWYLTDKRKPLRLLLGGSVDTGVDVYLKEDNTNNPVAYFFNLSISPSLAGKYRFKIKNTGLELSQQIDVPLGSLISSSGYSSSLPGGLTEEDASFFEALKWASLGSYRKIMAMTTVDIVPSKERRKKWPVIRFTYIFSGRNYEKNAVKVESVNHIFFAGAMFRLFR